MSKDTKLLPCPFCGGEVFMMQHPKGFWTVEHKWTQDECPIDVVFFDTKEEAVERWNKRAERTCRAVMAASKIASTCSDCGTMLANWAMRYCPNCGAKVVE